MNTLEISSVMLEFYGHRVLEGVYMGCKTGEVNGILGRNGSGKSCFMKIAFGCMKASDKTIRINHKPLLNNARHPDDLRYLPQHHFIPASLNLKRIFKDFQLEFDAFTSYFPGFKHLYKSKLLQLSGGERRIVEIFCILASNTKFCLLDEPFSQVMPVHVNAIKQLINNEKQNKGIIITDHLYKNVLEICDKTLLLKNGRTIPVYTKEDLINHGYVKA